MLAGVFMPRRGNRRANSRVNCTGDKYIEKTVGDIYSWEPVNENLVTGLCPTTYITQNGALLSGASDEATWAGVKIDGGITQEWYSFLIRKRLTQSSRLVLEAHSRVLPEVGGMA